MTRKELKGEVPLIGFAVPVSSGIEGPTSQDSGGLCAIPCRSTECRSTGNGFEGFPSSLSPSFPEKDRPDKRLRCDRAGLVY